MAEYNAEFKLLVAKQAMEAKTYAEVGRKFGIPTRQIKDWLQEYKRYGEFAFEKDGQRLHTDKRLKEMEKRIADLEEENEILKKATAVFSRYQR